MIDARYRHVLAAAPRWNAVIASLLAHRSVRGYAKAELPAGTLETLIAAAQSAPTSSNLQVWSVVAVADPARKARLSQLAGNQKHIVDAPLFLVWLADLSRLSRLGAARGAPTEGLDYFEMFLTAALDAALAAQNALVAAESLGLGTVYIGGIRNKPQDVAAELGLPTNVFPVFGLCVGVPDAAIITGVKPRLRQDVVLHRETYDPQATAGAAVGEYDSAIQDFQREQGIAQVPWSKQALNRVAGASALSGRDRLIDALKALGFKLR
ncbi:MAG: NADPH-dependent oxidoreductase [Alphaproteobacteria bacterium]|nr:NADPH-dependent oxidoreductase [Alphaproteobacteria bacterium]